MKKYMVLAVFTAITLLNATSAESQIGINIGMNSTKNNTGASFKNPTVGINLQYNNYVIMPRFDLEYTKLKDEKASSLLKGSINGVYEMENNTNVTPYVLAGVGYENVQGGTEDYFESHPFIQGGGGLNIDLVEEYKAQVEGRFVQILGGENEENEAIIAAGIVIPLGNTVTRAKKEVQSVAPPRTNVVYVNNNECSIKTDLPDLDRDGVENRLDQCPATPCNFLVDRYGCPVKTTLKVNFESNSADIRHFSMSKIDKFASFLLKSKGSRVSIVGHTDSLGSIAKNLHLSEQRANAVVRALISRGVSPARLNAVGRGESSPVASNATLEGRAINRRIEAVLSYPKGIR